jgi:hypothetical protein
MRSNQDALLAWVVAGIPLTFSSLQAIVGGVMGVGTAAGLLAVPGFYGTAVATDSGGLAVSFLCFCATAGWLGQGLSLLGRGSERVGVVSTAVTGAVVILLFGWLAVSAATAGAIAPLISVALISIVTLGGVGGAFVLTSDWNSPGFFSQESGTNGDGRTQVAKTGDELEFSTPNVDKGTLNRLEVITPHAVRRVRENTNQGDVAVETELYAGIENAYADGWFDISIVSTYDQHYEIVNLPAELREIDLPTVDSRCHIRELERQVQDWIDDAEISVREIAFAVKSIDEHRSDIERHIEKREEKFDQILQEINSYLQSVRTVSTELDGTVGERARMLVVENRHSEFDGVGAIENGIVEAKSDLHECAFTEATHQLRELRSEAEGLLTAIEFHRSLVGGIEHGQQSARIPNQIAKQLYLELEPLLEQQYDVTLSLKDERVLIEGAEGASRSSGTTDIRSGEEPDTGKSSRGPAVDAVEPEDIIDESIYTLRDLKRERSADNVVEYQTEKLPEGVADPGVLKTLVVFCRRQSDIVEEVTLQENAPPGFLELRFTGGTTVADGIDELVNRFLDRYSDDR